MNCSEATYDAKGVFAQLILERSGSIADLHLYGFADSIAFSLARVSFEAIVTVSTR